MSSLARIKEVHEKFNEVKKELSKVIIGQDEVIEQILIAILCDSNALLESYPGLGKTTMIKTLADVLDLKFARIQSTPDLMPSDITGTYVIEEHAGKKQFRFQKGPLFANIVLADEINRATPKTQSALLEAMQEKQVTVGNQTFVLERPFFVLATQNPIDQEGTYPLPEAQTDRFLFKILVGYPKREDEFEIVNRYTSASVTPKLRSLLKQDTLLGLQQLTRQVLVSDDIKKAVVTLVNKTREHKEAIEYGASPRASIGLILAAKARALLHGRTYVAGEDIKAMAAPVLRHRIILSFKAIRAGKSSDDIINELIK